MKTSASIRAETRGHGFASLLKVPDFLSVRMANFFHIPPLSSSPLFNTLNFFCAPPKPCYKPGFYFNSFPVPLGSSEMASEAGTCVSCSIPLSALCSVFFFEPRMVEDSRMIALTDVLTLSYSHNYFSSSSTLM